MWPVQCDRHPGAVTHNGHCPACLLEVGLTPGTAAVHESSREAGAEHRDGTRRLTILLPLGSDAHASVFLVRDDQATGGLLRLKVWHTPASAGFLERFRELQIRLHPWRGGLVALPLAASLDTAGCPSVLSEFRQGIPLLETVRAGALDPNRVRAILRTLGRAIGSAHAAGLAHGSVVSGNVLVQPTSGTTHLLDFGLTAVLDPEIEQASLMVADRGGLSALARGARRLCPRAAPSEPAPSEPAL